MTGGGRRLRGKQNVAQPWDTIDAWLKARSLERFTVPPDGSCQFHSLALHTSVDHIQLRAQVIEFLSLHAHMFSEFLHEDSVPSYLRRMSLLSSWGDHITLMIMAAARLLRRDIHVISSSNVTVVDCPSPDFSPIRVAYNGVHYDAVFPVSTKPILVSPSLASGPSPEENFDDIVTPEAGPLTCDESFSGFSVASCNVTSLKKNFGLLDFADVFGIQESRHTAASVNALSAKLRSAGYGVLFGAPVASQKTSKKKVSRTLFNGKQGGVALAFRCHLSAQLAQIGSSERRIRLWNSSRWLHAMIPYGCGRRAFHVFVFYGFPGQYSNSSLYEQNESLLRDVFAEANLFRDLPCILLADLNCEPRDSATCRQACLYDHWLDTAIAANHCGPTHYPSHGSPRRLDVAFLNKTAAVTFRQYSVLDDCGLPAHHPVKLKIFLPALRILHSQPVKPKEFTHEQLSSLPDDQDDQLAQRCWTDVSKQWSIATASHDIETLWQLWSDTSEIFLCRRAKLSHPSKFLGRGKFPKFVLQPACSTSRPVHFGGSQTTCRERMLRKLARQITFLQSQLPAGLGAWPIALKNLLSKIQRRCAILKLSFSLGELESLKNDALKEADSLQRESDNSAISRWRDKLKLDFYAHKRETYKWLTREYRCPQVFLRDGENFTANSQDIDALIRSIWYPIMNRSSTEAVPSWDCFVQQFGSFFPHCEPFHLDPVTPHRLKASLQKMSKFSASGLDHWSVRALQSLPFPLIDKLCDLFHIIEQSSIWPSSFTVGFLCFIPKQDSDSSPSSLRPLSILSVLYRAWASCRLADLMRWQESWCHSSQFGFRSLHDCLDAWYPLALKVEHALLSGEPLCGAFLDYEKAFDLLPLHEIILPLAAHLGLPHFLVRCLSNLYSRLNRFLKHPKGFGSCLTANRGIVQGCPISVVLLNLLVSIFLRFSESSQSNTVAQAYADDVSGSSTEVSSLQTFLIQAGSFAKVTGQRLKASKCTVWCTSKSLLSDLKALRLGTSPLNIVDDVRYLGALFGFHEGLPRVGWNAKLDSFTRLVDRTRALPFAAEGKAQVIAACPIAKTFYGCELSTFDEGQLSKSRTHVLASLWSGRSSRMPEVLTSLIFPGHRCDPLQVVAFKALRTLRDMCLKSSLVEQLLFGNWTLHHAQPGNQVWGPTHTALNAISFLGWTWQHSFNSFERPVWPPLAWKSCSRSWLLHEVRFAMRQNQLSKAALRVTHLAGFSILDKFSTVFLLKSLLSSHKPYAAGTLKAILANAIKTAVIFHKSGLIDSPLCPFCDAEVEESTLHIYEDCPCWDYIRSEHSSFAEKHTLPWCTRYTGIACLPDSTISSFRELHHRSAIDSRFDPASLNVCNSRLETIQDDRLCIWLDVHSINSQFPFWRRCGFGFVLDSLDAHASNHSDALFGPDQILCRAFATGMLRIFKLFSRAVHVHINCSHSFSLWCEASARQFRPDKIDHIDLVQPLRSEIFHRLSKDLVTFHQPSDFPKHFACAHKRAAAGVSIHQTPSYSNAFAEYMHHFHCITDRQQMMLAILLARDQHAQKHKLLTYSPKTKKVAFDNSPADQADEAPLDKCPEYLVHPSDFKGHCLFLGPFPTFSSKLRFVFGERFYQALIWYLGQLRFPDTDITATRGVTFLELCMDFELSTGIILPPSRIVSKDGGKKRRGGLAPFLLFKMHKMSHLQISNTIFFKF